MINGEMCLKGVVVPLLTPFDEQGRVDEQALERLVEFLIEAGVHSLNPCGTTGEGLLLDMTERRRVAERTVSAARGRIPVLVQTGAPTTEATIALTRHAREIGAAAANIVSPFYYRYDEAALVQHYVAVADSVPELPIYLYNIPQLTGNALTVTIVTEIARRCPNVIGLKDSSGSLLQIIDMVAVSNNHFQVAIGADGLILSGLSAGVQAAISGNANVFPRSSSICSNSSGAVIGLVPRPSRRASNTFGASLRTDRTCRCSRLSWRGAASQWVACVRRC